jgi:hypothetical protein
MNDTRKELSQEEIEFTGFASRTNISFIWDYHNTVSQVVNLLCICSLPLLPLPSHADFIDHNSNLITRVSHLEGRVELLLNASHAHESS